MKKLIKWLVGIVLVIVIFFGGIFLFAKIKYDINLFSLVKQVNILNEKVDENTMFTNKIVYSEDMKSAKETVNSKILGLISYDEETDTYEIGKSIPVGTIWSELNLTDRQSGAIIQTLLKSNEATASVTFGSKKIDMQLIELNFVSLNEETKTTTINFVIKLNLSEVKSDWKSFPLSTIAKKVPDSLYISSTVDVTKNDGEFSYTVASNSITINKLDKKQTEHFIKALNVLSGIGTANELNLTIGQAFVNGLIGYDSDHTGFAYALKSVVGNGVKDYTFAKIDNKVYFVLKSNTSI